MPSDEFPSPVKRPYFSVLDKSKIKETYGINILFWQTSLNIVLTINNELIIGHVSSYNSIR